MLNIWWNVISDYEAKLVIVGNFVHASLLISDMISFFFIHILKYSITVIMIIYFRVYMFYMIWVFIYSNKK